MTSTLASKPVKLRTICRRHTRYVAGCEGCREVAATQKRARTRQVAYGTWQGIVDATPIRRHLQTLLDAGLSRRDIARAARVSRNAVDLVVSGRQASAQAATAHALLAVVAAPSAATRVSSLGVSRRLQALMAIGWSAAAVAGRLDTNLQQVCKWRYRYQDRIAYRHHEAICRLYRELECRPGPSEKAQVHARTLGYAPPICWDDDGDLDDPRARPKGFSAFRRATGAAA
ncbi:hypothetical protein AMIS_21320 [Actinoplanes missouriensis 431]|uniref:Uncharacterized protein n=1 Tax=Actinoplanes missouriensis (strain ATCC 14538 / DSM 43046 / CBS 188.64 / JCM 3121 / NBRC 102363 / NCIMB 12654 / NRRL B-3342 / UNCC 431) TaxID=512565 RepID=I0H2W5_ACTM4|nr:hypothetical protein [Actinoplanes missouriensis]BAL87352.1 hypothetical protein AMIS_21320 [Actinoplanes missouriensis 431]